MAKIKKIRKIKAKLKTNDNMNILFYITDFKNSCNVFSVGFASNSIN